MLTVPTDWPPTARPDMVSFAATLGAQRSTPASLSDSFCPPAVVTTVPLIFALPAELTLRIAAVSTVSALVLPAEPPVAALVGAAGGALVVAGAEAVGAAPVGLAAALAAGVVAPADAGTLALVVALAVDAEPEVADPAAGLLDPPPQAASPA